MNSFISCSEEFIVNGNAILDSELIDLFRNITSITKARPSISFILIKIIGSNSNKPVNWPGNSSEIDVHMISQWEQLLRQLEQLNVLTCAIIIGNCNESGLEILSSTDFRIIHKDASIHINETGIWPGMGIYRLANQIGTALTRRICFFEKIISAQRAIEINLADKIVEDLELELKNFTAVMRDNNYRNVSLRRNLILEAPAVAFELALGSHLAACDILLRKKASKS
jgi:isomerase DpgB